MASSVRLHQLSSRRFQDALHEQVSLFQTLPQLHVWTVVHWQLQLSVLYDCSGLLQVGAGVGQTHPQVAASCLPFPQRLGRHGQLHRSRDRACRAVQVAAGLHTHMHLSVSQT